MEPVCSIIFPTWNKSAQVFDLSRRAIDSICVHVKMPIEVLVVDNNSPYACVSPKYLSERFEHWAHFSLSSNRGFGKACNLGFRAARGRYVCQMNTDCELVEDSITLLIGAMEKYGLTVGMPENFGGCQAYNLPKTDEVMGADWRFGAFWIAERAAILDVGGFDEGFDLCYWEDTDLWRRLEHSGYRIAGWRGTWVMHVGNASAHPQMSEIFMRNKERYEDKWGPVEKKHVRAHAEVI